METTSDNRLDRQLPRVRLERPRPGRLSNRKARSLTLVSSKRKAEASGGRGGAGGRRRQHRDRGGARGRGHGLDEGHMGRLADEVVLPPC